MPGLELRLPVLFDAMVSRGRLGLEKFVELTATAPAQLYGLAPRKGGIAVGADADLALWDPERIVEIEQGPRHDGAGYTPYAGRTIRGWPVTVAAARRGDRRATASCGAPSGSGRFPAARRADRLPARAVARNRRWILDAISARTFGRRLAEFGQAARFAASWSRLSSCRCAAAMVGSISNVRAKSLLASCSLS